VTTCSAAEAATAITGARAPQQCPGDADLTIHAFEVADCIVIRCVLADGALGQMMEPVEVPKTVKREPEKPWAVKGEPATRKNLITSIFLEHEKQEILITRLEQKYQEIETMRLCSGGNGG
jgi:hypothetical protein